MKNWILGAILAPALLTFASLATAQTRLSDHPNGIKVAQFYDMVFNQRKVEEAFRTYVGPTYTQHNPVVPDGIDGAIKGLGGLLKAYPNLHSEIKRVFVDGDYVILHVHSVFNPGEAGRAIVDIFRLDKGKVVEHWDVIQAVPEKAANTNTMF
jgi:predicted SnoaL-like aldol condensation-catalyzing enzyme